MRLYHVLHKFSIKDFFSKFDQSRIFLRIWSHLLKKKSLMGWSKANLNLEISLWAEKHFFRSPSLTTTYGWHYWHIFQKLHGHVRLNASFLDAIFFLMPFKEPICNISFASADDGDFAIAYRKMNSLASIFLGIFQVLATHILKKTSGVDFMHTQHSCYYCRRSLIKMFAFYQDMRSNFLSFISN